ncbi:MFS transporter [Robinsoniella peoriensis]
MKRNKLHYAWLILLGVIMIRGFAGGGINMTSGLFLFPVSQEIGVGMGSLSIYFSITSIVMVLWLPFAGKLINKYDIRIVAIAGAVLQALSFAGMGFMNAVYGWYLLAIPYAMGATILVSLLGPILINRWFAKNAGMMMGIQMAFVGLFGAVFQPVTSNIISIRGWRTGYIYIGGSFYSGCINCTDTT